MKKIVFYIDVGNMPKLKAEEFVQRIVEKFSDTCSPKQYDVWAMPRRSTNSRHAAHVTHIEVLNLGA